jgi:hypothetical protein
MPTTFSREGVPSDADEALSAYEKIAGVIGPAVSFDDLKSPMEAALTKAWNAIVAAHLSDISAVRDGVLKEIKEEAANRSFSDLTTRIEGDEQAFEG